MAPDICVSDLKRVCTSVSEECAMGGCILTSDHVIPSFQDTEGPPAKSWTSLLKEETPEVSEGPRGTTEPHAPLTHQHPIVSRGPSPHGPSRSLVCCRMWHPGILPFSQMGRPGLELVSQVPQGPQGPPGVLTPVPCYISISCQNNTKMDLSILN